MATASEPVRQRRIQAFLLDVLNQRLVVLQGAASHSKPKIAYGVSSVAVVDREDWGELLESERISYGLAKGFALEELQLRGVELGF